MLLDLSEALACPRCGPPQVLIVLVERMAGRRVAEGHLDCPACQARFRIRDGSLDFRGTNRSTDSAGPVGGGEAEEDALIVGALLGIRDGRGLVVLGPELGASADRVGTLCGGCEVLLLGEPEAVPTAGNIDPLPVCESERLVTALPGVGTEAIPLLAARVLGVALVTASEASIGEASRVLVSGGRLVVLRPEAGTAQHLGDDGFEVIAEDPRAIVARRI